VSRGCAFGDFDNDGDLDIVNMNQNEGMRFHPCYATMRPRRIAGLKVKLQGTKSNRSAIEARVIVRSGGKVQAQEVMSQSSYVFIE
jgi:hypothetical protein